MKGEKSCPDESLHLHLAWKPRFTLLPSSKPRGRCRGAVQALPPAHEQRAAGPLQQPGFCHPVQASCGLSSASGTAGVWPQHPAPTQEGTGPLSWHQAPNGARPSSAPSMVSPVLWSPFLTLSTPPSQPPLTCLHSTDKAASHGKNFFLVMRGTF